MFVNWVTSFPNNSNIFTWEYTRAHEGNKGLLDNKVSYWTFIKMYVYM